MLYKAHLDLIIRELKTTSSDEHSGQSTLAGIGERGKVRRVIQRLRRQELESFLILVNPGQTSRDRFRFESNGFPNTGDSGNGSGNPGMLP